VKVGYKLISLMFVLSGILSLLSGYRIFGGLMIIASQLELILDKLDEISERKR